MLGRLCFYCIQLRVGTDKVDGYFRPMETHRVVSKHTLHVFCIVGC